jgi:predicted 3-demethylubiquinone-9 3-methyltransferase (glyoxalase superfamily)
MSITPCLWFDGQAEEAAEFYVAIFPDSAIEEVSRYGSDTPGAAGAVMMVRWRLGSTCFSGINGGPQYSFTEAVSFQISCTDQAEVDHYWDRLSEGGEEGQCGWLKDRFGVSWQVIPQELGEVLSDPDPERAGRAVQAMMAMKKLDVAALRRAADFNVPG